jgi:hypothetical protein
VIARWAATCIAVVPLLASRVAAQATDPQPGVPVVQYVDIIREDIADTNETGFAARAANALHIRTRQRVVEREVLLKPGMPYDSVLAAETARNLRALGIFRDVLVDTVRSDSGLTLRVVTKDGWTTFPIFDITTAAGQSAVAFGVAEANLLGLAALGLVRYSSNPDRTAWLFAFKQPRIFAGRINLGLSVEERSDGRAISGQLGMPFYSVASRWALGGDATYFDGDVLVFANGILTPYQTLSRQLTLVRVDGAKALKASPRGYVRAGIFAQLESNSFLPSPVTMVRLDTTQVAVGAYVSALRARFAVVQNVRSFGRVEDVAIGQSVRVGLLAAPSAFGYAENGVGLQLTASTGFRFPASLAQLSAAVNGLVTGSGVDSGSVVLKGNLIVQPNAKNAIIVGGFVGWQKNPVPGNQFDLGLVYGPRAYPLHAFVGDRGFLVAAEYRWTFAENLGGLLGLALGTFVDYGGAWYSGEVPRTGTDFGAGIRFGPNRSANPVLFRLDLAYRLEAMPFPSGWSIVFGEGFTF